MNSRNISIALGLVIIVVAVGILIANRKSENPAPQKTVRVGYLSILTGAPHFIALNQGWYDQAGIKIEAIQFESSNQLYDAVAKGDIDITPELSSMPPLINHLKDPGKAKIYSITKITNENPFDKVIVPGNSLITNLIDLTGKKIGVFPGSTGATFLKDYLAKKNIETKNIEFVQLPPQTQLQALDSGAIDALFAYEPVLTTAIIKNGAKVISEDIFASYSSPSAIGAGIVSTSFLKKDSITARKMINIYDKAFNFIETHESESRNIVGTAMNIDQSVADAMHFIHQTTSDNIGEADLQRLINILVTVGELQTKPNMDTLIYRQ